MKKAILAFLILSATAQAGYDVATFADTKQISGVGQYNNDTGGFTSGGQFFNNNYYYDPVYGSYATGFAVSSMTDTTTPGYTNQYSAITGSGNGDAYYGVLTPTAYVNLTGTVQSIDLTNTTYAYLSMLDGDSFNTKFTTGDYFNVVITGYSEDGATGTVTGSYTYSLADYTSPTDTPLNTWKTVDLTSLGSAQSLGFSFESSNMNDFGITVPEYVAVDNLVTLVATVPEPSSWLLCATGLGIGAVARRLRLARNARI